MGRPRGAGRPVVGRVESERDRPDPDERHLVACQTNLGRFWRVALASGQVEEVALRGGPLEHCDGMALSDSTLYVAINARNRIAVIDLANDGASGSGSVRTMVSSDEFAFP